MLHLHCFFLIIIQAYYEEKNNVEVNKEECKITSIFTEGRTNFNGLMHILLDLLTNISILYQFASDFSLTNIIVY